MRVSSVTTGVAGAVVALVAAAVGAPAQASAPVQAAHGGTATTLALAGPAAAAPAAKPRRSATFRLTSFNVLGASHTPAGGRRASGTTRIKWVNRLLDSHKIDVAGFQELQASQLNTFLGITKGEWAVYPGLRLKKIDSDNSIGWRTDKFELLQATTVKIPYFDGNPRAMPLVLLRHKRSGMMGYFTNYHNPADRKGRPHDRWRAEATRVQIALQQQLYTRGLPRFVTGDMNERADYFCTMSKHGGVKAARPQSVWRRGKCEAGRPRAVDWIMGARKVQFSNYVEDWGALVSKTSDHPMINATATVDSRTLPKAFASRPPAPVVPRVSY